ncbi:MAG: hypothetical protein WCH34_05785 [Bacteroidota bacterium]
MLDYISKLRNRFVQLLNGVSTHPAKWAGQAESPITIQANIHQLDSIQQEITQKENELNKKKKEAREIEKSLTPIADGIKSKAIGFHNPEPEQLQSYGIKLRKAKEKKAVPDKKLTAVIEDDVDGKGFKISTQFDPLAEHYEWEKGESDDPKDLNHIPEFKLFKSTTRISFIDDEIEAGVRYFYRVRAVNRRGKGAWSVVANKIQ